MTPPQPREGLQKAEASDLRRTKTASDDVESVKPVRYKGRMISLASFQAEVKRLQDTLPAKLDQIKVKHPPNTGSQKLTIGRTFMMTWESNNCKFQSAS